MGKKSHVPAAALERKRMKGCREGGEEDTPEKRIIPPR